MKTCIDQLSEKFPKSPSTYALMGMQLEVQEQLEEAGEYYEFVLSRDKANIVSFIIIVLISRRYENVKLRFYDP